MNKIEKYLYKYEDLWYKISDNDTEYPIMDIALNEIDENDYYACDFSRNNKVMMLFFAGSSNFFLGIWIGESNYKNQLDQHPIYLFDLSSDTNNFECIGNFRTCMEIILTEQLNKKNIDKEMLKEIKSAYKDLDVFSRNILCNNDYLLKRVPLK